MQDDNQFDSHSDGVTRRDLFRIGNVLAMPVLMGAASARVAARGRSSQARAGDLPVHRRRTRHQLPRHVHDHRWVGGASRGTGRDGRGVAPLRADRRVGGRGRAAACRADRRGMGHGVGRMRGGTQARHRRMRDRRQSRTPGAHPRSHRLRQDRGRQPALLAQRLRRGGPQRRRDDDHGRIDRGTRALPRPADGDDLSAGRRRSHIGADVAGEHREDRPTEEHPHPHRRRGRGLDDAQRAPPGGRGHRRLQWRQGTCAARSARDWCSGARTCSCRPGRPVLPITVLAATTRWVARRRSACWPRSKPG